MGNQEDILQPSVHRFAYGGGFIVAPTLTTRNVKEHMVEQCRPRLEVLVISGLNQRLVCPPRSPKKT